MKCSNNDTNNGPQNGDVCLWEGTLEQLEYHLSQQCPLQEILCPVRRNLCLGCSGMIRRKDLGSHISDNLLSVHRQLNKANNELVELRAVETQANEINSLQKEEIKTLRTEITQLNEKHQQVLSELYETFQREGTTKIQTAIDEQQKVVDRLTHF